MKQPNLFSNQRGAAMLLVLVIATVCLSLMGAAYISVATVTNVNITEKRKSELNESAFATMANLRMLVDTSLVDLSDVTFDPGEFKGIDNINYPSFTAVPQTPSLMGGFLQRAAVEKIAAGVFQFHVVVSNPATNQTVRYDGLIQQLAS